MAEKFMRSLNGYPLRDENAQGRIDELDNKKLDADKLPTKISEFENDEEYISNKPGMATERLDSGHYTWIEGEYCSGAAGNFYQHTSYCRTGYIAVEPDWRIVKTFVRSSGDKAGIAFYNSAKVFILGASPVSTGAGLALFEYEIPSGAKYFCVSTKLDTYTSAYIEIEKEAKGALDRISALESAVNGASDSMIYAYAASSILCIGDSLTAGAYYAGNGDGSAIAQNYPHYLGRMLNCRATNAGTSGYSASNWYNKYIDDHNYAEYDTTIIWLGTNYGCASMPTDDEIAAFVPDPTADASTANQALYLIKIIQTIQAANASCHIVLCNVFGSESDKTANNEVVAQIAEKYGCQLVDMSDLSASNRPDLHAGISNPHFGKVGNMFVANRLAEAINAYIADNPLSGEFGITASPFPTLTASEKNEIVAAVIASLPVYSGEVV